MTLQADKNHNTSDWSDIFGNFFLCRTDKSNSISKILIPSARLVGKKHIPPGCCFIMFNSMLNVIPVACDIALRFPFPCGPVNRTESTIMSFD